MHAFRYAYRGPRAIWIPCSMRTCARGSARSGKIINNPHPSLFPVPAVAAPRDSKFAASRDKLEPCSSGAWGSRRIRESRRTKSLCASALHLCSEFLSSESYRRIGNFLTFILLLPLPPFLFFTSIFVPFHFSSLFLSFRKAPGSPPSSHLFLDPLPPALLDRSSLRFFSGRVPVARGSRTRLSNLFSNLLLLLFLLRHLLIPFSRRRRATLSISPLFAHTNAHRNFFLAHARIVPTTILTTPRYAYA